MSAEPTLPPTTLAAVDDVLRPRRRGFGRIGLDLATLAGLACGLGLIAVAVVLGGAAGSFLNLPALLIVVGGTLSATVICFSFADVLHTARLAAGAVVAPSRSPADAAAEVLTLAESARRHGILPLQRLLPQLDAEAFLHKGLACLIDGLTPADLQTILVRDLQANGERGGIGAQVLRRAAEFAPAMGLIGTLIGLVQMLGRLDDPSAIGPSMAVALLTTLYGAVLANLVLAPLAAKLDRNAAAAALIGQIQLVGLLSIARQENPRQLEILLNTMLPPGQRLHHFD